MMKTILNADQIPPSLPDIQKRLGENFSFSKLNFAQMILIERSQTMRFFSPDCDLVFYPISCRSTGRPPQPQTGKGSPIENNGKNVENNGKSIENDGYLLTTNIY